MWNQSVKVQRILCAQNEKIWMHLITYFYVWASEILYADISPILLLLLFSQPPKETPSKVIGGGGGKRHSEYKEKAG